VSKAVKINVYKIMVKAVIVYESATWAVSEMDINKLGTWERKR
jgi:hypothetical protein